MKPHFVVTPARLATLALVSLASALGAGCSSLDGILSGDKIDYKTNTAKARPLEVPPDLTQLARDSRFQSQSGVVSASSLPAAGPAAVPVAAAASAATVAMASLSEVRVERAGQQRWLVVSMTPEQLWPQLKAFWEQRGFVIASEDAKAGVMETNWAENRGKLPNDVVRNTIGRLVGNLYDTGERDLFRTRVERAANGSEIFIAHRGAEEVYTSERKENTTWRARASDPQLEAEFLTRLMVVLGTKEEVARPAVAAAPEAPARARAVSSKAAAALEVDEPFDRAWRRVGLALDRSGFTVEDRDRAGGLYFVRYINPKNAGKEEPGFFGRLFGDSSNPQAAVRYRIAVQGSGEKTNVSVLTSAGAPEAGENGQRIVGLLVNELR
jgi:outer membrane protein assembly factor BamC